MAEKGFDATLLRDMTGAAPSGRGPDRPGLRNGERERDRQARAGTGEPRIPGRRRGSCSPASPEARRTAAKALTAVIGKAHVQGISTRPVPVDELVRAMGMEGISCSQVSRLCAGIGGCAGGLLARPIGGDRPHPGSAPPAPRPARPGGSFQGGHRGRRKYRRPARGTRRGGRQFRSGAVMAGLPAQPEAAPPGRREAGGFRRP
ncbi:transposase [Caldovatus sediminis]|uniref:transposase n=1 Tax=Caldovatus sediminis TaxID=2041189 RepID=UPI00166D1418